MQQFQFEKIESFSNEKGHQTARFYLKGLEQGQGITIGNTLRRALLTELEGTAITAVKVYGVNHEYGTIAGIREDILELLLNLKQIKFRGKIPEFYSTILEIKGPCLVTASDIPLSSNLTVINKSSYIATISEKAILKLELKIETNRGYNLVDNNLHSQSGQFLSIDSIFTPVKRVFYTIHDSYLFSEKLCEELELEITTDRSLTPDESLLKAAQILQELFGSLDISEPKILQQPEAKSSRKILIEELELSVRAYNCLKTRDIHTIDDLRKYSLKQLKEIKNFGQKSANDVIQKLQDKFNIRLN